MKRLDRELAQLAQAVAAGGDLRVLVTAMQNKQRRRETAAATVDRLEGLEKAAEGFDVGAWVEETRELLEGPSGHAGGRSCRRPRLPP